MPEDYDFNTWGNLSLKMQERTFQSTIMNSDSELMLFGKNINLKTGSDLQAKYFSS